jgi:hypothetical protein
MLDSKRLARRVTDDAQRDSVPAALQFTPERIVAGITFHLLDEGIGTSVALESTRRTLSRLRQESFTLTISSRIWASLSNAQRLKRLLEESRTEPSLLGGGTIVLAHRSR